jgi:release factor glutamine methyltransferase
LDTELLLAKALNWNRIEVYMRYEYPLSDAELQACRELVRRRISGEPVAYILQTKDFFKSSFFVSPAVLIPRPDTELLVETALSWQRAVARSEDESFHMIDFGTGSGCIGLSLLKEIPDAKLIAVDISADAIEVAQKNAQALDVAERVAFFAKPAEDLKPEETNQLWQGARAQVITANPPYIVTGDPELSPEVLKFEPHQALFSQDNGLAHFAAWSQKAAELIAPEGLLVFEIGTTQGRAASEILLAQGTWSDVRVLKDLAGHDRCVRALRKAESNG